METIDLKATLQIRLDGIKDCLTRSRIAFFVATVISVSIILGIVNAYFSWDRDFGRYRFWNSSILNQDVKDRNGYPINYTAERSLAESYPITSYLQQRWLDQWVQNQQISSSLLGVRVSTSDATLLASCALTITMIWFFWCSRRENHSVHSLLRDTASCDKATIRFVFHGIAGNLVFTHLTDDDTAYSSFNYDESNKGHAFPFIRVAYKGLGLLPVATIAFSGIVQFCFLQWGYSPFRPPGFSLKHPTENYYVWIVLTISVVALFLIGGIIRKIDEYRDGVKRMLIEYEKLLK